MIIRDTNGNLVNIKRSDFVTDGDYYKQLSLFYNVNLNQLHNMPSVVIKKQNVEGDITTKMVKDKLVKDKILDYIRMM